MRNLVSYDDIAPVSQSNIEQASPARQSSHHPSKKRKWNNQHSANNKRAPQHWDDPSISAAPLVYEQAPALPLHATIPDASAWKEESRELTHEDIWDDSALIEAWNAAEEEYEALNGPEKAWKNEPIHKSPLWYNTPPTSSKHEAVPLATSASTIQSEADGGGGDSHPLDFDTFVPSHDPSLSLTAPPPSIPMSQVPGFNGEPPIVGRDEAFQNALASMYWTGYWTAAYYYQAAAGTHENVEEEQDGDEEAEVEDEIDMEGEEEEFVPTQR